MCDTNIGSGSWDKAANKLQYWTTNATDGIMTPIGYIEGLLIFKGVV